MDCPDIWDIDVVHRSSFINHPSIKHQTSDKHHPSPRPQRTTAKIVVPRGLIVHVCFKKKGKKVQASFGVKHVGMRSDVSTIFHHRCVELPAVAALSPIRVCCFLVSIASFYAVKNCRFLGVMIDVHRYDGLEYVYR